MSSVTIFLISGKKGAGKDTVANDLKKCLLGKFDVVISNSLAGYIKWLLPEIFSIPYILPWSEEGKRSSPPELCGKTVREALQTLGTEGLRAINPDIHCIKTMEEIHEDLVIAERDGRVAHNCAVVPDCRFINEARFFLDMDQYCQANVKSFLIKLTRDPNKDGDAHASEDMSWWSQVPDGDRVITIDNENMTLEETLKAARSFALKKVRGG